MDLRGEMESLRQSLNKFVGSKRGKEDARLIRAWAQAYALADAMIHFQGEDAVKILQRIKKDSDNF